MKQAATKASKARTEVCKMSTATFSFNSAVMINENWNRDDFKALLKLVKSFVLLIWETRKKELYGDQDCVVSGCSCSCPLTGGLTSSACVCGCVVNGVSATAAT